MKKLVLDKRLFNPIYWHIQQALKDEKIRFLFLIGGSSAGKTYSYSQASAVNALEGAGSTLVFRKESTTIDDSVYADYKSICGWINAHYKAFVIQDKKIKYSNGQFRFRGMDDPEKAKGISQYQYVFMNELSSFEPGDFEEVERRLRGKPNQTITCDLNPISEDHWFKVDIIDKETWIELPKELPGKPESRLDDLSGKWMNETGNTILIRTTYRDNYWVVGSSDGEYGFIDEHTISTFEKMRRNKPNQYQVYGLGNWGSFRTGGEFWKAFDIDKHVKEVPYLLNADVHVTIDINRLPYITQTLWQYRDLELRQFDELLAATPDNTASKAAIKLADYLDRIGFKGVLHLYGDASGNNKTAIDNDSFFGIYIRELKSRGFIINDRILKSNPSVSLSGAFINEIYEGNTPFTISIGDNCTKSKTDYNTVKEDKDGGMCKEKVKDGDVTYEKSGHISDAKRYFIVKLLNKEFKDFSSRRKSRQNR